MTVLVNKNRVSSYMAMTGGLGTGGGEPIIGGLSSAPIETSVEVDDISPLDVFNSPTVPLLALKQIQAMSEEDRDAVLTNFRRVSPIFQQQGKQEEEKRANAFNDIYAAYAKDPAGFIITHGDTPSWNDFTG